MLISEVKAHLSSKLQGDNIEYELSEFQLLEALLDILRRTSPRTHIIKEVAETYLFKYFRRVNKDYWLRYPVIDLDENAKLDMEEELCMAVIYFLLREYSKTKKELYHKKAEEIIAIYDTNVNFRYNPRYLNCYLLPIENNGDSGGGGSTPTPPKPSPIPILKTISIEVGKSETILVDSNSNNITATSDNSLIKVKVNGNKVVITSYGEVEKAYITIRGGNEDFRVEVFSAESDGGIID